MITPISNHSPLARAIIDQLSLIRLDRLDLSKEQDRKLIASIVEGELKRLYGPIEGTLEQLIKQEGPFAPQAGMPRV